jgi:hypothetical protein
MANLLTDLEIEEISLVDKAANKRSFLLFKADSPQEGGEVMDKDEAIPLTWVAKLLTLVGVRKADIEEPTPEVIPETKPEPEVVDVEAEVEKRLQERLAAEAEKERVAKAEADCGAALDKLVEERHLVPAAREVLKPLEKVLAGELVTKAEDGSETREAFVAILAKALELNGQISERYFRQESTTAPDPAELQTKINRMAKAAGVSQ